MDMIHFSYKLAKQVYAFDIQEQALQKQVNVYKKLA